MRVNTTDSLGGSRSLLICILWCVATFVYAQSSHKFEFSGRVLDADTRSSIAFATVRLLSMPDSTYLSGCATGEDGRFRLSSNGKTGTRLLLHVSYVGYTSEYKSLVAPAQSHAVGDILLSEGGLMLDEAVVIGKAPMAVTEQDTTVFNASAYRTTEGAMLEDLVKQLPGGEITEDGKLLIHGKEVKKILVDGKEFFSDDPKVAMKNLPVEMVEKLKAYERKSELTRLTGIDDGEEEMILDLSVKKDMKKGWMNNFMMGAGTKSRYEAANTMNRIREDGQLAIIANINNTNNQGFSELQQESASASGNGRTPSGLSTSRSLGMNFSRDWQRLKWSSNVQYGGKNLQEESSSFVDNILKANHSTTRSANDTRTRNHNLTANASVEWKLDSLTTLIFRPQYRYTYSHREGSGLQQGYEEEVMLNERNSSSLNETGRHNLTMMLQLSRKWKKGRSIALKLDYGLSLSDVDRQSFSTTHYTKNDREKVVNQKIENGEDGSNYRLQLVYSEPLPWKHFLQFRYSYQYRMADSEHYVYNWDTSAGDFMEEYDVQSSNSFENRYSTHLFNVGVRTNKKKYNYNIGVDMEPQKSVSRSVAEEMPDVGIEKNVFNVSPTVNFRYKRSKRTNLQLVYRGRSRQPRMTDLQPVTDTSNPLNIRIGNPDLKPTYTHSLSMTYRTYNVAHQRNMVFTLQGENVKNNVTNMVTYDEETGGRTTQPVNQNGNWNTSGSFVISTPFLSKSLLVRSNSLLRYRHQNSFTNVAKEAPVKNTVHHLTARERLQLTYRHSVFEATVFGSVLYNHSYNTIRQRRTETFDYQVGGDCQFYLPWGLELYSEVKHFLRVGYNYQGTARSNTLWHCQLSKSMLKHKQLILRLKVYDLLKQENSLVRTVTASAIRDTDSNALGSYAMFHLIWRLNRLGKSR